MCRLVLTAATLLAATLASQAFAEEPLACGAKACVDLPGYTSKPLPEAPWWDNFSGPMGRGVMILWQPRRTIANWGPGWVKGANIPNLGGLFLRWKTSDGNFAYEGLVGDENDPDSVRIIVHALNEDDAAQVFAGVIQKPPR